jgi:hypothetical protein
MGRLVIVEKFNLLIMIVIRKSCSPMDKSMVRILIVANVPILGEALETVIAHERGMEVFRFDPGAGDNLAGEILHIQPDVIIAEDDTVNETLSASSGNILDQGRLLVIRISSEKEIMQVCEARHIPVTSMADIVEIIKIFNI